MSRISCVLDLVARDSDVLERSVVNHPPSRFGTVDLPMETYSRPQPGKDRSDRAAPCGSVGKIGLLGLGPFSDGAILRRNPMAKVRGANRFEVSDALFDRC